VNEKRNARIPYVTYTRGNDLSGSLKGAGGIGEMLARTIGYNSTSGAWGTHDYYHADGNGNITYLEATNQTFAASYRYDPYGNTIASTGTSATANLYRFSSKQIHLDSGMSCFLYRFYDPGLQRWLNRDPIEEDGGINLYTFVANEPPDSIDPYRFGLWQITRIGPTKHPSHCTGFFAEWIPRGCFHWTPTTRTCKAELISEWSEA